MWPIAETSSPRISSTIRRIPGAAARREAPLHGPSDQHGPRPEGQRLEHVRAAADPAVHQDLQLAAGHVDDLGQRVERRLRPVELAAAVVRHDDPVQAVLDREAPRPPRS